VAGNPASPVISNDEITVGQSGDVADVVAQVFDLDDVPLMADGPDTIAGWDSLGALRLLVSIEQRFGCRLDEERFVVARTIDEIQALVDETHPSDASIADGSARIETVGLCSRQ
jgi:acyl carrier protein